jgi:hypothetical protein
MSMSQTSPFNSLSMAELEFVNAMNLPSRDQSLAN